MLAADAPEADESCVLDKQKARLKLHTDTYAARAKRWGEEDIGWIGGPHWHCKWILAIVPRCLESPSDWRSSPKAICWTVAGRVSSRSPSWSPLQFWTQLLLPTVFVYVRTGPGHLFGKRQGSVAGSWAKPSQQTMKGTNYITLWLRVVNSRAGQALVQLVQGW